MVSRMGPLLLAAACLVFYATQSTEAKVYTRYSAVACEGSTMHLNCSVGYGMHIDAGFWGRDSSDTCLAISKASPGARCSGVTARAVLRSLCEGRRSCDVKADELLFGTPCNANTKKYVRATYICQQVTYKALVCENTGKLPLACRNNQLIVPQSAFFGRDDNNLTCPHPTAMTNTSCYTNQSFNIFRELCEGKQTCEVDARVGIFGEPCNGTYKYLRLSYLCAECANEHKDDAECEFFASRGNCTNNKQWMVANCRKACTKCDNEPPACENAKGDDAACKQWASDGFCEQNPAYMNAYCRKTCSKCDQKTQCLNKNNDIEDDCQRWAADGQCSANAGFMLPMCSASCIGCAGHIRCENTQRNDTACEVWANDGQCDRDPGYMMANCMRACTRCTSDPPCSNIEDDAKCAGWAAQGECTANGRWMYTNCWKTCMQCEDDSACINKHKDDTACDGWATQGDCGTDWMKKNCASSCALNLHNNNTECRLWANGGQCESNPSWMPVNCRRDCRKCGKTDCRNKIAPISSCDRWAEDGKCRSNMAWMETHCSKSCFKCDDIVKCENKDGDEQCGTWTVLGQCHKNPSYMLANCLKSCIGCRSDPVCKNEHRDIGNCHYWAGLGECETSAVWMHKNCWQACLNCSGGPAVCANAYDNDAQCESWAMQGECQLNPVFMLKSCHLACSRCKPMFFIPDCLNQHDNDTYCEAKAAAGECYTNPNWMLPLCRKACTGCDNEALRRGSVGSDASPGDINNITRSNTLVLDEFAGSGVLTHFSGFFTGNTTIQLQVWRRQNDTLEPFYDSRFRPAGSKLAQTILASGRCTEVQRGDRIGFTSVGNVAPLATNYDVQGLTREVLYRSASSMKFDSARFPLRFSIAASYDKTRNCGNG